MCVPCYIVALEYSADLEFPLFDKAMRAGNFLRKVCAVERYRRNKNRIMEDLAFELNKDGDQ